MDLNVIEVEKDVINIEFTERKSDSENDKNAINFSLSDVQEGKQDIAKANLIESLKKQDNQKIFPKK